MFELMNKRLFLSIFFLSSLFFFTSSCKKTVENKIDGKWKKIDVANVNSDTYWQWEFSDGYLAMIECEINGNKIDTLQYLPGDYTIKRKDIFKRLLIITDSQYGYMVGEWQITKLTSKILTLYRNGNGYQDYFEFEKND